LFQYFPRRSTDSLPRESESEAPAPAAAKPRTPRETAGPVRLDTPPSESVPHRGWFHTAGEWMDLSQLDPVDWGAVFAKFSNSVVHLQPPYREGHTAREDELTARPQCKPPSTDDHTTPGEEVDRSIRSWFTTED